VVKLRDFDLAQLEASDNPCATVVLAHLTAQATRNDPTVRARAKVNLTRRLYHQGYDRAEIQRLYRFIDWLLQLPKALETATWLEIKAMQEEQEMTYVTTAERYGRSEGLVEGLQEGIALAVEIKFGPTGRPLLPEIQQIKDLALLHEIMDRLKTAATLDQIRAVYKADS
jgi:hypothetical protein